jgi:hypothetical protein
LKFGDMLRQAPTHQALTEYWLTFKHGLLRRHKRVVSAAAAAAAGGGGAAAAAVSKAVASTRTLVDTVLLQRPAPLAGVLSV